MILTAGFVLGEAFGLLKIVAVEMALTVTLVFGLALLLCLIVEEAGAGEREKAIRQAEKVKSNSQAIRAYSRWLLLALFFSAAVFAGKTGCRVEQKGTGPPA